MSKDNRRGPVKFELNDGFSNISYAALFHDDETDIAQFGPATIDVGPVIAAAIARTEALGLVPISNEPTDDDIREASRRMCHFMANAPELTEDWYLVKIFTLHRQLKLFENDKYKVVYLGFIIHTAKQIGAFCREYELSIQNKRATLARKKQLRALSEDSSDGRAVRNAERRAEAEQWREEARRIAAASKLRGQGLEAHIRRELERRGHCSPSGRSIRRALKAVNQDG